MKSNFSSEILLCNLPVILFDKRGGSYELILPTLRDRLEDLDFDIFISFCAVEIEEINSKVNTDFKDKLSMFDFYKKNKVDVLPILEKFFKKFMKGFKYVDDSLYWGERLVGKEIFEAFCNYISVAAGVKDIKSLDLIITEDMDEYDKKRILAEKRIQKTKAHGLREGPEASLSKILTGVVREFNYKYNELLDLTLYCIYYMYSQLGSITNYEIGNIAAGNGLLKKNTKHNHWAY